MGKIDPVQRFRFPALDGLRGIAAFIVFLSHASAMYADPMIPRRISDSVLHAFWDGRSAVVLFFVLSGFVLAVSMLDRDRAPTWRSFVVRRFFRIYPAYWATLTVTLFLEYFIFGGQMDPRVSEWARAFWAEPPDATQVLLHVVLILPGIDRDLIVPVIWSLVIEMRVSLIFPAIVAAHRRFTSPAASALGVAGAFGFAAVSNSQTIVYLPLFVLGAAIAFHHERLLRGIERLPRAGRAGIWIMAFVLYSSKFMAEEGALSVKAEVVLASVGSALLILAVLSTPSAERLLTTRVARVMGLLSYPFFLIHLPILLVVASRLSERLGSMEAVIAVGLVLASVASYLLHRFVERPMLRMGREVTQR